MADRSRYFSLCLSWVLLCLLGAGLAEADEVIMKNGDRITGTMKSAAGGTLIITTEYAGPITVRKELVEGLRTEKSVEVHLQGAEVVRGRLVMERGGGLTVEGSPDRKQVVVDWDKVVSLNPPAATWTAGLTVGGNLSSGNTRRKGGSLSLNVSRKTGDDRISIGYQFNYEEDGETVATRNHYGTLKYDHFVTKRSYGYLSLEMLSDGFKDLNLRTAVGPGAGYQVWDEPGAFLLLEMGLSFVNEDRRSGNDDQFLTARLAVSFRHDVFTGLIFSDSMVAYPSLKNIGEFIFRNEAALSAPVGSGWSLRFANIWDYESDPADDALKSDIQWILGMQYAL